MEECYQLAYEQDHKEFLRQDVEMIQKSISRDPRFHRVRALISDPELIHPDLKKNVVFQVLYSAV